MPLEIVPVYVSSTWRDLGPERKAVEAAVNRLRETKFVGMEYFGCRDETTRQASLDDIDRSRVYLCIIAGRYGSGITEEEYDRARERGLYCLIYFKDRATIPDEWREQDPAQAAKLDAFRKKLRENHLKGFDFKSPDDLAARVTADLHRWLFDDYLPTNLQGALSGKVSHDEAQKLLDAVKDLRGLKQDLLDSLRGVGFNIASGERSVAYTGDAGQVNINTGDTHVHNVPTPVIPTLHQLRAPVGDFVGREQEIADLLATLRGGGSAAITGISGMGGIGKTELSFYVAERLRDTYPDAQLVLDMRGTDDPPRDPSDALASCIRAFLGLEYKTPDNLDDLTRLYRSTLEGKRALILLDNAHDSTQVRPLLPPPGSALFITSRETISLPGMRRVTLEQLPPPKARELLTLIASHVPAGVADQICHLCGYLPLAVRAAASLLDVTPDLDPADYVSQLSDERTRLKKIGVDPMIGIDVEASIGLSYKLLSADDARVFRQLAVFPATFDAKAEEAICEDPGHEHLTDLRRRSLVLYNLDTRRYRLHDLARLFADSRMSDDEGCATRMRHAAHYLTVLGESCDLYLKGGDAFKSGIALFDIERRNIEAGQEWACRHSSGDEAAAWLCNEYPAVGVYVLGLRQHPREFISWLEAALAAARQLKDRASEGAHSGNLGYAYDDLGEYRRAIEFYEQRLIIAREINDRRGEGDALGNLGTAYAVLGEMRRAIDFYEQCLAIACEIGDRRIEGNTLNNLALYYSEVGEPSRAVEFCTEALVIFREIGDRRGEGSVLGSLGSAYDDLGNTRRAIEFNKQALVIHREIGNRRSEGIVLFNIGLALDQLGDHDQAIAHAEAALEIFEQIESPYAKGVRAKLAEWHGEATGGE